MKHLESSKSFSIHTEEKLQENAKKTSKTISLFSI